MRLYCEDKRLKISTSVDFGTLFFGPGTRGFFGEGYWYQKLPPWTRVPWGEFESFAAKTMTVYPNAGNMPLRTNQQPDEFFPACIKVYPKSGHMLNAVGLANPGMHALFADGRWQKSERPLILSVMFKGKDPGDVRGRLAEAREFVKVFRVYLRGFRGLVALQVNFACPNTGIDPAKLYGEVLAILEILSGLGIPLIPNFNALVPVEVLQRAEPWASAFWIANTILWGSTPEINWKSLEPSGKSPLPRRLGDVDFWARNGEAEQQYALSTKKGGLSGPLCFPLTLAKVRAAREAGIRIPIVAGNGIQSPNDVEAVFRAGASGVALATVATLRPWRVPGIIRAVRAIESAGAWGLEYPERRCLEFTPSIRTALSPKYE